MRSINKFEDSQKAGLNLTADTSSCSIDCLPHLIRKRAYDLYEARHGNPGSATDDWLKAEREIKHHFGT
jgi:hypothetical protein